MTSLGLRYQRKPPSWDSAILRSMYISRDGTNRGAAGLVASIYVPQ